MIIWVQVKPGSKKGPLIEQAPEGLVVYVRERAVDGAANKAVQELLADYYGKAKSNVVLTKGSTSAYKQFTISD